MWSFPVRLKADTPTIGRPRYGVSGFSRTQYGVSGFSRPQYGVSGFSRTQYGGVRLQPDDPPSSRAVRR